MKNLSETSDSKNPLDHSEAKFLITASPGKLSSGEQELYVAISVQSPHVKYLQ